EAGDQLGPLRGVVLPRVEAVPAELGGRVRAGDAPAAVAADARVRRDDPGDVACEVPLPAGASRDHERPLVLAVAVLHPIRERVDRDRLAVAEPDDIAKPQRLEKLVAHLSF